MELPARPLVLVLLIVLVFTWLREETGTSSSKMAPFWLKPAISLIDLPVLVVVLPAELSFVIRGGFILISVLSLLFSSSV